MQCGYARAEKIYQEKFTGTTTKRPEFNKLLKALKADDTLIITKLDRFAHNTKEALEIIESLFEKDTQGSYLKYEFDRQYSDWSIDLYHLFCLCPV